MPNSRRRRFSVRNGIAGREPCKIQNGLQTSAPDPDPEIKTMAQNLVSMKSSKSKNKMNPNSSRNFNNIDMIPEYDNSSVSVSSVMTVKKRSNMTVDKNVTASSSNIDLFIIMNASKDLAEPSSENIEKNETPLKRVTRQVTRDRTPLRRDKYPRQHRIKVRSPKRRAVVLDTPPKTIDTNNGLTKITVNVATEVIDWVREFEVCLETVANVVEVNEEEEERQSDHSFDDMCRICHGGDGLSPELGQLISACSCRGTVGRVHVKCLERWLTESGKSRCELCGTRYATRRVHRYGVPRALVMWILSQNAKQLMVDSLGIMLMSPLAVLAAWLSGRTLAGLMTQDAHATPWPLASTFVLACMTLVCYYCWIVSAATRHALGWWIWYRSQYEVRLQLHDGEE